MEVEQKLTISFELKLQFMETSWILERTKFAWNSICSDPDMTRTEPYANVPKLAGTEASVIKTKLYFAIKLIWQMLFKI